MYPPECHVIVLNVITHFYPRDRRAALDLYRKTQEIASAPNMATSLNFSLPSLPSLPSIPVMTTPFFQLPQPQPLTPHNGPSLSLQSISSNPNGAMMAMGSTSGNSEIYFGDMVGTGGNMTGQLMWPRNLQQDNFPPMLPLHVTSSSNLFGSSPPGSLKRKRPEPPHGPDMAKVNHSNREKRRRDEMNEAIKRLTDLLPPRDRSVRLF